MTTYMIHDSSGEPVSVGTVVADPLPGGLTALALSDIDADKLRSGWRWNPATLAVDIAPPEPEPDPVEVLQAQVAELTAALQALTGGD